MEDEVLPILEITKRQKNIPWIEFGQVHVGSQFKKCLKVVNRRSEDVRLSLKLVGFQEGLSIEFEDSSPDVLVHSGCVKRIVAVWEPSEEAKFKKSVQIVLEGERTTFKAHVVGSASDRNPKKAVRVTKKKPLRTKKSSEMNKKPTVRSKVKSKKRPAPRKRSSSQAPSLKRSNHDEHLDTKQQEAAFQVLLNNVLCKSNDEEDFESPFHSNETNSKTAAAHPILLIQKKKEQLLRRRRACQLFCTPEFSFTMEQISEEILSGKLSVREDKVLSADVGLQNILIELLFQYVSSLSLETYI